MKKLVTLLFLGLSISFAFIQSVPPKEIVIERDGISLIGKFYSANGEGPFATLILLNGFPGSENDVLGLGEKICKSGINVLTFNYCGTFKSGGKNSWDNVLLDIDAAFKFTHSYENIAELKIDTTKIYLGGWCTGGGMAISYAANHHEVKVIFAIAPSDQKEFMKRYVNEPWVKEVIDKSFDELSYPKGHIRFEEDAALQKIADKGLDNMNPILDLKKCAPQIAPKNILLIGGWDDIQTTMETFILPLYRTIQNEKAKNIKILAFQDDHYFEKTRKELGDAVIDWLMALE